MFDNYPNVLTVAECCEILEVGNHTIYQLIAEGKIRAYRVGEKIWRIPRTSLAAYVLNQSGLEVEEEDVDEFF